MNKIVAAYYFPEHRTAQTYSVSEIPAQYLTHLIYAFANVSTDGLVIVGHPERDLDDGQFQKTTALKKQWPHLKILLAVGGWTWSKNFSEAAISRDSRRRFAESALEILERHDFDGLDIDWEFPVVGGEPDNCRRPEDRENFTLLLEELRRVFDGASDRLGKRLLVTAAMGAGKDQIEALETDRFHKYLDWINLMTYDFHGPWYAKAGHNSSLTSAEESVNLHLQRGFPAEKLVVGSPFYGYSWSGVEPGPGGDGVGQSGKPGEGISWDRAEKELRNGTTFHYDLQRHASWIYDAENKAYYTYDSPEALEAKLSYVKRAGLAGIMTWQVTGNRSGEMVALMHRGLANV